MFDGFKNFIRQAVYRMNVFFNGQNIGGNMIGTTDVMRTNIENWYDLYQGIAPWLAHNKQSLGLPAAISSEIARLVTLEMEINIKSEKDAKSEKAEFLDQTLNNFRDNIRNYCECACASGGVMFKPFYNGEGISIECVQAVDFEPITFDNKGVITSCKFVEHKVVNKYIYHRLEEHKLENEKLTITNKCYKATSNNERGFEVPLSEVLEWAEIEPAVTLEGVKRPLYQYFKIPLGNNLDPNSPLGVSVFARAAATGLIEEADKQFQRYCWEFEGGELAIDASKDVFPNDTKGKPILPQGKERLFRANELDETSSNELIKVFSPSLREAEIKKGLNTILQRIEFVCGLAYGTLSDPTTIEKTAEEIRTSKQRSYSTVSDIQKSLEKAIKGLIDAICVTAEAYKILPSGEFNDTYVWDDSIIVDTDTERTRDMSEVRQGLMLDWEYRMKWYGEDEETAKSKIAEKKANSASAQNPFNLT